MAEVDTIDITDEEGTTRTVATASKQIKTLGLPADAASTATDTTSVTHTSLLKQISKYLGGTLTVAAHAVTNAGTFATQATLQAGSAVIGAVTQSGSWVLSAGTAIIGKVGIDQTTDGTTNLVRLGAETTKIIGIAKVGDGTSVAAVKAASTAPVATDPALVVTLSPNGVNANGRVAAADSAPVVLSTEDFAAIGLDNGPAWTSVWGVSGVPYNSSDATSAASVTDAPISGKKLCIDDLIISVDTAMAVTFKEETSGTVMFGPYYLSANSGPLQITPRGKKKLATADKKLQVVASATGNITVQASYHSE